MILDILPFDEIRAAEYINDGKAIKKVKSSYLIPVNVNGEVKEHIFGFNLENGTCFYGEPSLFKKTWFAYRRIDPV